MYVASKNHGKICNQGACCPSRRQYKNPGRQRRWGKYAGVNSTLKIIIKTAYNELILYQEYTVCLEVASEAKPKANKYGDTRRAWLKLLRKFDLTTGDSKKRLCRKLSECKIYSVIR